MPSDDSAPINATLTDWEDGTDLVIDTRVAATPERVWDFIAEPQLCAQWFAPWHRENADTVELELDDEVLVAHILSCEPASHVLFDTARIGRLGLSLRSLNDAGTRITLSHTFPDAAAAARGTAQFGPVWETHLRMLCEALGQPRTDIAEGELYTRYDRLASGESADGEDELGADDDDGTRPNDLP